MNRTQLLATRIKAAELKAARLYDAAFEIAEAAPGTAENAAAEHAWELAEDACIALREELAAEIVKYTAGLIDSGTAYKMTFRPELYALIDKMPK